MLWRIVELACGVTWRPCHSFISYAILQLILKPSLYLLIYLTSLYLWWWRPPRLSRRNHQNYKPQMEQRSTGGMTSSNVKTAAKPARGVVAVLNSLRFAVKQSQFGKFFPFFTYRYCNTTCWNEKCQNRSRISVLLTIVSKAHTKSNSSRIPAMFKEPLQWNSHWKVSASQKRKESSAIDI